MNSSKQTGYSLIELMIGLVVGLIVLSAVGYVFITSLKSSKDVLNSYRLNQEVGLLSDLITGELRRTGYWPISGAGASVYGAQHDLQFVSDTDSACILYSYYDDSDFAAGQIVRGFRFDEASGLGTLSYVASTSWGSCSTAAWTELTDSSFIDIDRFDINFDCWDVSVDPAVSVATSSCGLVSGAIVSRTLEVIVEASVVKDPIWKAQFSELIKIQNDINGK